MKTTMMILLATSMGSTALAQPRSKPGANRANPCLRQCMNDFREQVQTCVNNGGGRRDCAPQLREGLRACSEACDGGASCQQICKARGGKTFRRCIQEGGDEEVCTQRGHAMGLRCMAQRCGQLPPCPENCKSKSKALFDTCIDEGGDDEACAEQAREAAMACVEAECDELPDCVDYCRFAGGHIINACYDNENEDLHCRHRGAWFLGHCLRDTCDMPEACEAICRMEADALLAECQSTVDGDDCRHEVHQAFDDCLFELCAP